MTRFQRTAVLALLLVATSGTATWGQCMSVCGDCNQDGQLSILDALFAAQIGVGLISPTPEEEMACDVQPAGGTTPHVVDVTDALVLAQLSLGLSTSGGCFPVLAATVPFGPGTHSLTVDDPNRASPDFGCIGSTMFLDLTVPPGVEELTVSVTGMSIPTDVDLYIGNPGVPPGDSSAGNYVRRSLNAGIQDESLTLACSGLASYGGTVAVAVHAFDAGGGGTFQVAVTGGVASLGCNCGGIPTVVAGQHYVGTQSVLAGPEPPLPCGPASRLLELPLIPAGTTRLSLLMRGSTVGDYDLWCGWPLVCGGECYASSYHGSSQQGGMWVWGNPLWREELELTGSELMAYGSGPLAIGVSVISGPPGGDTFSVDIFTHGPAGPPIVSVAGTSPVTGSNAHCRIDDFSWDKVDIWEFAAVTGQTIDITADTVSAEGAYDPQIALVEAGTWWPYLATGDDDVPCTFPPPLSGGSECPSLTWVADRDGPFEVQVFRGLDGLCHDASNGVYLLSVTVNGTPVQLVPTGDDL